MTPMLRCSTQTDASVVVAARRLLPSLQHNMDDSDWPVHVILCHGMCVRSCSAAITVHSSVFLWYLVMVYLLSTAMNKRPP